MFRKSPYLLLTIALITTACASGPLPELTLLDTQTTSPQTTSPQTTSPQTTSQIAGEEFCLELNDHLGKESRRLSDFRTGTRPNDPQLYLETAESMLALAVWMVNRVPQSVIADVERLAILWHEATIEISEESNSKSTASSINELIMQALTERQLAMDGVIESINRFLYTECSADTVLLLANLDPRSESQSTSTVSTTILSPTTVPKRVVDFIRKLLTGNS